jgi:hypothetical protein
MRIHPQAFFRYHHGSHSPIARDAKNAAGAIVILLTLTATLFGPLLFSPENDANLMGAPHPTSSGTRNSAPEKEIASSYQLVSSDNPNDLPEQRAPIHVPVALDLLPVLKDHEQELLQSIANKKEKVIDKVDHAKLANVVSISASVAILLGAFAAGKVAKGRFEHTGVGGGGVFDSDSNAGRISDDVAYDIAYTSTASDISYGSFAPPWIGDLEKFDV